VKRAELRGRPNDTVKLRYGERLITVKLDARGRGAV
jgi:hypothetical protein